MAGEFENRVIVLTGAAGGIGQETARQFAAAGAKLVLSDREDAVVGLADELVAAGGEAVAVIADVTHADQVARIAVAADEAFGGVDVLVNNHGMILGRPFLETTEAEWDQLQNGVLKSVFLVSQAVVPLMLGRAGANVVNISSVSGLVALKYMSIYGTAKAAVIHLSKGMAIDLAEHGIRVNAICPGIVDTSRLDDIDRGENWERLRHIIPMRRHGTGEDIANMCVYLCSDQGSWITGQAIHVDGGQLTIR